MAFRGVSLAAGLATRLRPLTTRQPKAAMPILGVPSLYFPFQHFERAGLSDWAVNCHHAAKIVRELVQGYPKSSSIYVSEEATIQGSGGCYPLLNTWRGSDHLLVYNPDVMSDFDLRLAIDTFNEESPSALVVYTEQPPPGAVPSVHVDQHGYLVGLGASKPPSTYRSVYGAGIFLFSDEFLATIPVGPSSLGEHFLAAVRAGKKIKCMAHAGFWVDMGDSHSRFFLTQKLALAHLMKHPHSQFSLAIKELWDALDFSADIVTFPNDPDFQHTSLINKRASVSPRAKIGPSCFVFNEQQLEATFVGEQFLTFGKPADALRGEHRCRIMAASNHIDLA